MPEVMLITGTRKGIGRHLVDYYLAKDYVVVGCSREPFEGTTPPNYHHYQADVADEKSVVAMVRDVHKHLGGISVLINNAGIASMNHLILTPLSTVRLPPCAKWRRS
jgi:3-oxoacyl-[acyl-carrier protein] reductase